MAASKIVQAVKKKVTAPATTPATTKEEKKAVVAPAAKPAETPAPKAPAATKKALTPEEIRHKQLVEAAKQLNSCVSPDDKTDLEGDDTILTDGIVYTSQVITPKDVQLTIETLEVLESLSDRLQEETVAAVSFIKKRKLAAAANAEAGAGSTIGPKRVKVTMSSGRKKKEKKPRVPKEKKVKDKTLGYSKAVNTRLIQKFVNVVRMLKKSGVSEEELSEEKCIGIMNEILKTETRAQWTDAQTQTIVRKALLHIETTSEEEDVEAAHQAASNGDSEEGETTGDDQE